MLARGASHLVGAVEGEVEQALHLRLLHGHETAPCQVLAQEHTEHGRLRRVLGGLVRQVDARMIGRGRQQQPSAASRAAHGQNQRVALRLLDLIDAAAGQTALQLTTDRREEKCVKWHGIPPWSG